MKRSIIKNRKALLLAITPALCALRGQVSLADEPAMKVDLSALSSVHLVQSPLFVGIIGGPSDLPPPPINPPPVNGFVPRVIYTLTDEQMENDFTFASYAANAPGGSYLGSGTPYYASAIFDTGSQSHIVRWQDAGESGFNIANSSRAGTFEQDIQGVGGPDNLEVTDISDPLGIYVTGYGNAGTGGGAAITIKPGSPLKGQWSTAILSTRENDPPTTPSSVVPSLVGSPMASQFQVHIKNSQTRQRVINGQTIRTPQVELQTMNTALPGGYSKLALGVESGNGVSPTPNYFPSFDNFDNFADNPSTPSFWASFTATVSATNTDTIDHSHRTYGTSFMFDTGAEVSVLSSETAANLGIYVDNPDTVPDFTVDVEGVGGTLQAPGFYLDTFSITTTGGPISWQHVPMLVLDITDPRDFVGFIPGIMGTNLFTDRDIFVNGITTNPFLGIGPQHRQWAHTTGGNWSTPGNWLVGVPNGQNIPATFLSAISTAQTVNVDGNYTLGSISFDNPTAGYTLAGSGRLTMSVTTASVLPASMFVGFGSHTISSLMTLASNTVITIDQPTAKLTLSNDVTVNSSVSITKTGEGTLEMKNVRGNALTINGGKLVTTTNGTASGTSKVQSVALSNGALWDLNDNDLIVTGMTYTAVESLVKSGFGNSNWLGTGITSSIAATSAQGDGSRMVGVADNAITNYTTFSGQTVSGTDILVKFTYNGDANVDGKVNADDFTQFIFGFSGGGSKIWLNGDFDYNNLVNADDFNAFISGLNAFNASGGMPLSESFKSELANFASANGLPLVLPEPSGVGLALILGAGFLGRRRRSGR